MVDPTEPYDCSVMIGDFEDIVESKYNYEFASISDFDSANISQRVSSEHKQRFK